jgi:cytochrome c peroxidase
VNFLPKARLCSSWAIAAGTVIFVAATYAQTGNDAKLLQAAQRLFKPLPKDAATVEHPIAPERVELGRMLFFDPRMSADGTVSCSRCHLPALFAADGLPKAKGVSDKLNDRRAPIVLNAALQFKEHWRGDRENVEDQAAKALTGTASFGNPDDETAIARLKGIPGYAEPFRQAFPGESNPITVENWGKAIGCFERTLMTPSRFDEFLSGNLQALSAVEREGLRTFIAIGCAGCHNGPVVGGGMFQKFGIVEDYWKETGSKLIDKGRFDVTHNLADMYVFKVAGLRNAGMSPFYFHDGSVKTLAEAVRIMSKIQLGKTLSDKDGAAIVTFLRSLTGRLPQRFAEAPVLPPGGFAATPASDIPSVK